MLCSKISSRPLFFKKKKEKLFIRSKQVVSTLILIYFRRPALEHATKTNCITFQTVDPEICSISISSKSVSD